MSMAAASPSPPGEGGLRLQHETGHAVTLSTARGVLLRYVYALCHAPPASRPAPMPIR